MTSHPAVHAMTTKLAKTLLSGTGKFWVGVCIGFVGAEIFYRLFLMLI
jgi:hypothetical protein